MIPATQTLKDAIASPARQPVLQITLTLGSEDFEFTTIPDQNLNMITAYSLQRTPQEQAIRASQISGTIAAQCNFTLQGWQATVDGGFLSSDQLSVYKAGFDALRDNDYGIDAKVAVRQGYVTSAGVETVQVFVGFVDKIDVSDEGAISFLCLDFAGRLQGDATLPAFLSGSEAANESIRPQIVAEHLLRSGGFYLTPPARPGCVLSIPSLFAEVGQITTPVYTSTTASWSRHWRAQKVGNYFQSAASYTMTEPFAPRVGTVIAVEFWASNNIFGLNNGISIGGCLTIGNDSAGYIRFNGNRTAYNAGGRFSEGAGNGHFYIEVTYVATGIEWYFRRDSAVGDYEYSGSIAANDFYVTSDPDAADKVVWVWDEIYSAGIIFEGLSVTLGDSLSFSRVTNANWVPNFETSIVADESLGRLAYMPQLTGSTWSLLQEMSGSSGGCVRWTEQGVFEWLDRSATSSRTYSAPIQTLSDDRALVTSGYSYDSSSRRSDVTVKVSRSALQEKRKGIDPPSWTCPDVVVVKANSTQTILLSPDVTFTHVLQMEYRFTDAGLVGDPAAWWSDQHQSPWSVRAVAHVLTSGELQLVVNNWSSVDLAFWDPVSGEPYLQVWGTILTGTDQYEARTFGASARSKQPLLLEASQWQQVSVEAIAQAEAIAAEAALPAIVFSQQQAVGDPTRTVGDVIDLQASTLMDDPVPCIIIGKDAGIAEDTLTVVPCYPPTGWVLGVTGRSELGTTPTTVLVA